MLAGLREKKNLPIMRQNSIPPIHSDLLKIIYPVFFVCAFNYRNNAICTLWGCNATLGCFSRIPYTFHMFKQPSTRIMYPLHKHSTLTTCSSELYYICWFEFTYNIHRPKNNIAQHCYTSKNNYTTNSKTRHMCKTTLIL